MSTNIITNCGCCGNVDCQEETCYFCIRDGEVVAGLAKGYSCLGVTKSYFTHEAISGTGDLVSGSCSGAECTANQYQELMVTFSDFTVGFQECQVSGGSFVLINPARNTDACWPYLGMVYEGFTTSANCSSPSPCQSDTTSDSSKYIEEFGVSCRWEYGGGSYNFRDSTDGNTLKLCTTHAPACNECHRNTSGGFPQPPSVPSSYGLFTIVFTNSLVPTISIAAGNVVLPYPIICGAASASYQPVSGYVNCEGETVFQRVSQSYGSFPSSITLEVL